MHLANPLWSLFAQTERDAGLRNGGLDTNAPPVMVRTCPIIVPDFIAAEGRNGSWILHG